MHPALNNAFVKMSKKAFIKEHTKLPKILRSKDPKVRDKEARKQEQELRKLIGR